jgi:hypothetical protein
MSSSTSRLVSADRRVLNNEVGLDQAINTTCTGWWNSSSPHDFIQGKGELYFWANNGTGDRLFWHNGGSAPVLLTDTDREGGFDPSFAVLDASPRSLSGELTDGHRTLSSSRKEARSIGPMAPAWTKRQSRPMGQQTRGSAGRRVLGVSLAGNHAAAESFRGSRHVLPDSPPNPAAADVPVTGLWRHTPVWGTPDRVGLRQ